MKTAWTEKCFNSTLVQLKVTADIPKCNAIICFNSTLVQLKGSSWTYNHVPHSCFNSTLVQLKVIERAKKVHGDK